MIQRKSAARRSLPWAWAAIIAAIGVVSAAGPAASSGPPRQLVYRVVHSVFGDIGTYINTVEPDGTGTLVLTQAHFDVRMLGVRMYHEVAERTERWQGNRLVSFDGVTDKGHGPVEVKGVARGNQFVITSPQGTFDASATVHPANPWSANFLRSNEMMRPDTGRVEPVHVSGGEQSAVTVGFNTVAARKYDIDGHTKYTVWLDGRGLPVKFAVDDDTGKVTFTLDKCIRCGPDAVQLGAN
jgi:Domain of unknown function (DUF6134)